MITIEFSYKLREKLSKRNVLVIRESDEYIEGLDLNLLENSEVEKIKIAFKDFIPKNFDEKVFIKNYDHNWNRAYRLFLKSNIEE